MIPLVDGHFHIWRRDDLPWLRGPMQPRIFGPYEPIRRDYPMTEYLADASAGPVSRCVFVQANWAPEDFEAEVAWVQGIADEMGAPHAIVGYADMLAEDVRPQLDRLIGYPELRGVRMQLHWHPNPLYRFASSAEVIRDKRLRANLRRLEPYGLPFELQLFPHQMRDGAALAAENPRTPFIIVHGGMLVSDDPETVEAWRHGMSLLAAQANCFVKLSGLGTFVHRVDGEQIAFVLHELVELFGADRCLFGSNFPIEKLWSDYAGLLAAYRGAAASLPHAAQRAIFHQTATRLYRLPEIPS